MASYCNQLAVRHGPGACRGPSLSARRENAPLFRKRIARIQPLGVAQQARAVDSGPSTVPAVVQPAPAPQGVNSADASSTSTLQPTVPRTPAPDPSVQPSSYVWERNWVPVAPLSILDATRPYPVMLLGKSLVVWRHAGHGSWVVQSDVCPHRLAPLSEGRLEHGGTRLACAYHGWEFNEKGQCTRVPQLVANPRVAAATSANRRSCIASFPTLELDGLLFVWLDDSAEGRAASQVARKPELHDENVVTMDWMMNEMPADYTFWLEQAMDPSHASFLHEGLNNFNATTAVPMMGKPVGRVDLMTGFQWEHEGYEKPLAGLKAVRKLQPPFHVSVLYNKANGSLNRFWIMSVPVRPGVTRVFGKFGFGKVAVRTDGDKLDAAVSVPAPKPAEHSGNSSSPTTTTSKSKANPGPSPNWFKLLPHWVLFGQLLGDQDLIMMIRQEGRMRQEGLTSRNYNVNSKADAGVVATNRWLSLAGYPHSLWGKGRAPQTGPSYSSWPAQELSLEQLLSRQERHVRHCKVCQDGMKLVTSVCMALTVAAGLAALAACTMAVVMAVSTNGAAAARICWSNLVGTVAVALALVVAAVKGWAFREDRFVSGVAQWRRLGGFAYTAKYRSSKNV